MHFVIYYLTVVFHFVFSLQTSLVYVLQSCGSNVVISINLSRVHFSLATRHFRTFRVSFGVKSGLYAMALRVSKA